jgi:5-methylcytosine-specific restriction endonuclease McrA
MSAPTNLVLMTEHTCPSCGAVFDSRRGLGVHHSTVHGERLPNRECENCGVEFYCDYEKKYCSDDCRDETVTFTGRQNPNYDGGKEQTECELCGTAFEYYPSEKEGLYCRECVDGADWRDPPAVEGTDHPRWKGGKVEVECAVCGEPIERYPSHLTGEVSLCSDECRYDWLSETFTGEGHPNWEGGPTGSYGPGWNRVRRRALERDGRECVVCGQTRAEIGRNPDVHHIVPVRVFARADDRDVEDAHDLANVVSLCVGCHRKAEFGNIPKERLWDAIDTDRADRDRLLRP